MAQPIRFILLRLFLLSATVVVSRPAHADLITFFDFNDKTETPSSYKSDRGRTSVLTNNFAAGSADRFSSSGGAPATGTTLNADPDDNGPEAASPAGDAFIVDTFDGRSGSTATVNNGHYLQFGVSTSSFSNLAVDFAGKALSSGAFTTVELRYSATGPSGAFVSFGTASLTDTAYALKSFDLSSVSALNNNPNTVFRFVFTGGTSAANTVLDNLTVTGVTAVPEPSTWLMLLLGLVSIGGTSWKRHRKNTLKGRRRGRSLAIS